MRLAAVLSVGLAIATSWEIGSAQARPARDASPARRELEMMAQRAEADAVTARDVAIRSRRMAEAQVMRRRLAEGDFQVGDRIVLRVTGDSTLRDTMVVRTGPVLSMGDYGDVSLRGVLRQELVDHLTIALARYIREPRVEALTLVRLAVLGAVTRPGYYHVAGDALMTDLVMIAGGPNSEGDLARISIRRDAAEFVTDDAVRSMIAAGSTVTDVGLRAGDEIVVGERKRRSVTGLVSILSALSAVAIGIVALSGS